MLLLFFSSLNASDERKIVRRSSYFVFIFNATNTVAVEESIGENIENLEGNIEALRACWCQVILFDAIFCMTSEVKLTE